MTSLARSVVWIVDDNASDAERARLALAEGYDAEIFTDGSVALEQLVSRPPPVVLLLDWLMPGVSGLEVCKFLRSSSGPEQNVAILLLTTHKTTEQLVEGLSAGANDFLGKPFEPEELRARVDTLVTARALLHRAEQAEDLNQRLLESAPDPMLTVDQEGRMTFGNRAATEILDRTVFTIGADLNSLIPGLPTSSDNMRDGLTALPDVRLGSRIYSPTVSALSVEEHAKAVSLRDVTDRRLADARRLDFYSIAAHDLRSPLSALMMRTDLMLRGVHGELPDAIASEMEIVDGHLHEVLSTINDFLDLARLEGVGLAAERRDLRLDELLEQTMGGMGPLLQVHGLSWQPTPAPPVTVSADPRRIAQVVSTFVATAIKLTPRGGVITTRLVVDDHEVEVSVVDNGHGIAPELVPHLLDRHGHLDGAAPEIASSALGLMLVREVIEAHGGSVGFDSVVGTGSRCWFRLRAG